MNPQPHILSGLDVAGLQARANDFLEAEHFHDAALSFVLLSRMDEVDRTTMLAALVGAAYCHLRMNSFQYAAEFALEVIQLEGHDSAFAFVILSLSLLQLNRNQEALDAAISAVIIGHSDPAVSNLLESTLTSVRISVSLPQPDATASSPSPCGQYLHTVATSLIRRSLGRKKKLWIQTAMVVPDCDPRVVSEIPQNLGSCCQFSPDGQFCATASRDWNIRIYDVYNKFRLRCVVKTVGNIIPSDCKFSPDGSLISHTSGSSVLALHSDWQAELPGTSVMDLSRSISTSMILSHSFHPTSSSLIVAALGGSKCPRIVLIDPFVSTIIAKSSLCPDAHERAVCFLDTSGQVVISGGMDRMVRVWDVRAPLIKPVSILAGHTECVVGVASRMDGVQILTNGHDHKLNLFDIRVNNQDSLQRIIAEVPDVSDEVMVDSTVQYQPIEAPVPIYDNKIVKSFSGHNVCLTSIRCGFSPVNSRQRMAFSGSSSGGVFLFSCEQGSIFRVLKTPPCVIREACWHPELPIVAAASFDGHFFVWDVPKFDAVM